MSVLFMCLLFGLGLLAGVAASVWVALKITCSGDDEEESKT